MKRKYTAVIAAVVGALLLLPAGASAGDKGRRDRDGKSAHLDVRVKADNSGRGSTDVDVRTFTANSGQTRGVQVVATPEKNRRLGPLDINVNAQVGIVQVVLKTADVTVLENVDVDVEQNVQNGTPPAENPGGGNTPPANGGNPQRPGFGPINITVNAQVAVVQIVVGTNNKVVLKNVDVDIQQRVGAGATP